MFFHLKREIVTRNYDVASSGFSTLPNNSKKNSLDQQEFCWSVDLVKNLLAIFSSIFLSALGYGMLMVLIAFKLEHHVKNEILISLSTATQIGAGVIFSRFLPFMGQKTGMVNSIYIGSIISAVCALIIYVYPGYYLWLLIIFFLGTSFFICGVTRNTIMIDLAPTHSKAIIISIGTMLVAIGNSFGPIIINVLKTDENFSSFAIASIFYLLSMLPLVRLKKFETNLREEKKISIWRYIKTSPKIMFAGFCVSYAMSSSSAFLIIYGIETGLPQNDASMLLSVLLFGTIFYIPIGYITDIINRRMVMIISAVLSLFCTFLLYVNQDPQQIHVMLFLLFGALSGIKLPAIVLINEKYKPTQRLAVNSAFAKFSLTGNICGLFCTGVIMKFLGPQGLWLSSIIILSLFLFFCLINYAGKILRKEFEESHFSIFNKNQNHEELSE
jgi:MFS family permease